MTDLGDLSYLPIVDIYSPIGGCTTDGDLPAVETTATIDLNVNTVKAYLKFLKMTL